MPSFIFADTSGWFAALDKNDADHSDAKALLAKLQRPLITTNLIVSETITLSNNRLGHKMALRIGKKLWDEEISRLIFVTPEMERRAWDIFQKFEDKTFSFVDCTSFVVMKELSITTAFTFDEHFKQAGFIAIP